MQYIHHYLYLLKCASICLIDPSHSSALDLIGLLWVGVLNVDYLEVVTKLSAFQNSFFIQTDSNIHYSVNSIV